MIYIKSQMSHSILSLSRGRATLATPCYVQLHTSMPQSADHEVVHRVPCPGAEPPVHIGTAHINHSHHDVLASAAISQRVHSSHPEPLLVDLGHTIVPSSIRLLQRLLTHHPRQQIHLGHDRHRLQLPFPIPARLTGIPLRDDRRTLPL